MSSPTLLSRICANQPDLADEVRQLIAQGADLDTVTEYGQSPLRVASMLGRFDIVGLLLDAGADWYQLGFTNTIHETVFGTLDSMRASVLAHGDLESTDFWKRTPLLVAIHLGDIAKAELLLALGASRAAVGHCMKFAAAYAIEKDDVRMLAWLAANGFDMEARDQFESTPLIEAANLGKVACVRFLAQLGVDLYKTDHIQQRALAKATCVDVVRVLLAHGDELLELSEEAHAGLLGVEHDGEPASSRAAFEQHGTRVFGTANPQRTDHPFWLDMIRCGASAYRAANRIGSDRNLSPVWCYRRFGRSTTLLADGRIIEIGGEHEDFYDSDFCIYNDVTVFDGQGGIAIYSYPPDVFPPTDFHTASVIGDSIYIVGCLGYREGRRPGFTPVFRLDLASMRIEQIDTSGDYPGWIYQHWARADGDGILIRGGSIELADRSTVSNPDVFRLCLTTRRWTRLPQV